MDINKGTTQKLLGKHRNIEIPSKEELDKFFLNVSMAKKKPAILKIIEPYAHEFIPKLNSNMLPKPITELYDQDALHMDYLSLLDAFERIFPSLKVIL